MAPMLMMPYLLKFHIGVKLELDMYVLKIDDEDEERSVGRLIVFINCWIGKDWLLPSLDLELH